MKNKPNTWQRVLAAVLPYKETPATVKRGGAVSHVKNDSDERQRQSVATWRRNLLEAEKTPSPDRRKLYLMYKDTVADGHVFSCIETRKRRILGAPRYFYNAQNEPDAEASKVLNEMWVTRLIEGCIEAKLWGHNLLEFVMDANGKLCIYTWPRECVFPEMGVLTMDGDAVAPVLEGYVGRYHNYVSGANTSNTHYPYRGMNTINVKSYGGDEVEAKILEIDPLGNGKFLGELLPVALQVMYKKDAQNAWADFQQLFALPLRKGTVPAGDPTRKEQLAKALYDMGQSAVIVLEDGDMVEIVESTKTDAHKVFLELMNAKDSEISKIILGQTLTSSQGDTGSRALGLVHEGILEDVTRADAMFVNSIFNDYVRPLLQMFPKYSALAGMEFYIDMDEHDLPLNEQIKIDAELLKYYDIPAEVMAEKYGVALNDKVVPEQLQPGMQKPSKKAPVAGDQPDPEEAEYQAKFKRWMEAYPKANAADAPCC